MQAGNREAAAAEFEQLAADGFAALPRDMIWFSTICVLAEVCAGLGDTKRAATLYDVILPHRGRNVMVGMATCWGSAERFLGLLAAARLDVATVGAGRTPRRRWPRNEAARDHARWRGWCARTSPTCSGPADARRDGDRPPGKLGVALRVIPNSARGAGPGTLWT